MDILQSALNNKTRISLREMLVEPVTLSTFQDLGVALALGLVVGLERGWSLRAQPPGGRYAGVRTFGLIGLLGGVAAFFDRLDLQPYGLVAFAAFALILVVTAARPSTTGARGITTFVAAIITFLVGLCAGFGHLEVAAAIAVTMTVLLGMKDALHRAIATVERGEIDAALQFLIISVIVLPILPNRGYGPWDALNPYQLWWMVVLISAISLAGHFAVKWMAPGKGILLTGILGGMTSSTAIAVSFSRMGKDRDDLAPMLAAGIVAASTIMFPRVLLVVFALWPPLGTLLLVPFGLAMLAGWGMAWRLWTHSERHGTGTEVVPPKTSFDLSVPLQFGAILAAVMLAAAAARAWIGDEGLYYVAAIAGLVDIDAMTVTASRGAASGLPLLVASITIVVAATSNTLAKAGFVAIIGGRKIFRPVALGLFLMTAAMAAGLVLAALTKLSLDAGATP